MKLGPAMIRMVLMGAGGKVDKINVTKLGRFLCVMLGSYRFYSLRTGNCEDMCVGFTA